MGFPPTGVVRRIATDYNVCNAHGVVPVQKVDVWRDVSARTLPVYNLERTE